MKIYNINILNIKAKNTTAEEKQKWPPQQESYQSKSLVVCEPQAQCLKYQMRWGRLNSSLPEAQKPNGTVISSQRKKPLQKTLLENRVELPICCQESKMTWGWVGRIKMKTESIALIVTELFLSREFIIYYRSVYAVSIKI